MAQNHKKINNKSLITYILISCCTYKRPVLLDRLIKNLLNIKYPENIKCEILIVDNDIEQSSKQIYDKYNNSCAIKIHYTNETEKGLSNVRNRAIQEGINLGASHIAFIDDDEIANDDWLINHINFYNNYDEIYVSSGPTIKKFAKEYPAHITKNKIFKTSSKTTGTIKKTCASGNVFFPLDIIKDNNIYFSKAFNTCGSEDTDFFSRISSLGYKIGWNCDAINYEIIDDDRAHIKWILKRAYNNGYTVSISKFKNNKNIFKRIIYILEKCATIICNIILTLFSLLGGKTIFFNMLTRTYKNSGKLFGALKRC